MNLRDIDYILSAAENGSFAKAAELCHVSQPSLSVQIKKVENELGHVLFVRDKRGVRLSGFGRTVLPELEKIRDTKTYIHTLAERQANQSVKPIKLGAIATVAPYIIPHISGLDDFIFEESTTADLIKKLLDDEMDATLLALPIKIPQLRTLALYREPFYLAAAENNPYIKDMDFDNMTPPDGCRFLALSDEHCLGEQTIHLCRLGQNNSSKVFKATSLETIRHMVSTSHDMTLMPTMAKRPYDGLTYYSLPAKYYRTIGLVYKSGNPRIEQIQSLQKQIKALDILNAL